MKNTSKCKIGASLLLLCLLTMTQVLAAPKSQEPEPPLGTWTQQGTDLNGDGVLSGEESETVFFFRGAASPVSFTLHNEGKVRLSFISCRVSIGGSMGSCTLEISSVAPGFNMRTQRPNINQGYLGVRCEYEPDICKFTITDVQP